MSAAPWKKFLQAVPLSEALSNFKTVARETCVVKPVYEGWPPRDRVHVGTISRFKRKVYVFNRRNKSGNTRETTMCICLGREPVLMMDVNEVEALEKLLPKLKADMIVFNKKIT
uniref:Uncharacterized protein n=1 Tax=Chromera velia CCMP2878 TaxID=1169474 RepID=A0A0G4GZQ3_9ALVE|mmetsp:Transcript_36330/g.71498  ORF Transcript_36330/g.71498 Transcript_36330/m.71498 type:complete len:114 (-) Transcript_36330:118-459(-)|eukprot:Cvel_24068.t1-p1 / transcript=Cvel_24068.t1 / gene=Cvel_24068 / organism=Chromera_velia_CCMP2878 / gene_product=hypothetical protein / transcript_product=hypothetical protein / location=Cvel_scaffold2561:21760-23483(-) / protein_length=113 / sequence_SO=supercontig / SO=protein_coding / is_pseudo=false